MTSHLQHLNMVPATSPLVAGADGDLDGWRRPGDPRDPEQPEALGGAARGQDRRARRRLVPAELGERGRVGTGAPRPVDLGTDRVRVRAVGAETVDGTRINEASATSSRIATRGAAGPRRPLASGCLQPGAELGHECLLEGGIEGPPQVGEASRQLDASLSQQDGVLVDDCGLALDQQLDGRPESG
jgi:hypothetical protein